MIDPNKVVIPPGFAPVGFGKDKMGLYRFKDGTAYLVRQHSCGDWQTMRDANSDEKKLMPEKNGDK